jgi:hypothetical protein
MPRENAFNDNVKKGQAMNTQDILETEIRRKIEEALAIYSLCGSIQRVQSFVKLAAALENSSRKNGKAKSQSSDLLSEALEELKLSQDFVDVLMRPDISLDSVLARKNG